MAADLSVYLATDRRHALACGATLPARADGAALFADVAGFTPLADALAHEFGAHRGVEELTTRLNQVYAALTDAVHTYGGSVVGFSGDAMTCWFDNSFECSVLSSQFAPSATQNSALKTQNSAALRAVACALAMQRAVRAFAAVTTPSGTIFALAIKVAVAGGSVRRFLVGDPQIQLLDVLAGNTLDTLGVIQSIAARDEVVLDEVTARKLGARVTVAAWRADEPTGRRAAIVVGLEVAVAPTPWPPIPAGSLNEAQLRPWLLPAVYARLCGQAEAFQNELRPAVALMLQFGGGDDDGDADLEMRLDSYIRQVQQVLTRYEGFLVDITLADKGGYLYAAFGALPAHADDACRAVRAALDLRGLSQMPGGGGVRIGISQGTLWVGSYGGPSRRTYGALGDAVNLACRLMSAAPAGEIWCDYLVARAANCPYAFEPLAPVRVKGKANLIPVYRPTSDPARSAPAAPAGALVGRRVEVDRLRTCLEAVAAGESRTLVIEGEAGIGKSRLVAELARLVHERGIVGLLGAGQSIEQQTPYRAWRDIFTSYFGLDNALDPAERRARVQAQVGEVAPNLLDRMPLLNDVLNLGLPDTPLTEALDAALRSESLTGLLVALLRAWLAEQSLVLVIEDAHWLDSRSWELTMRAARALVAEHLPLLLVVTTQPSGGGSSALAHLTALLRLPGALRLTLNELPADATVALAAARLGLEPADVPESIAALVRSRAGGNPFFAEEIIAMLREERLIQITTSASGDGPAHSRCVVGDLRRADELLPETLQGLLLARIDRLPAEERTTLKIAAVVGTIFDYQPLHYAQNQQAAISAATLKNQLRDLAAQDLTWLEAPEPNLAYRFKHILTQEAAYQTLLYVQRRALHRAVAEWYESTFDSAQRECSPPAAARSCARYAIPSTQRTELVPYYPILAHHYRHAEDIERERFYVKLAGIRAAEQYANAEAVAHFTRALELTPEDELVERYDILLARVQIYDIQGAREAQHRDLVALEALVEALDDDLRRAEVAAHHAHYADLRGDYSTAISAARRAVDLARTVGADAIAEGAYRQWAWTLLRQGDYDAAWRRAEQGLRLARDMGNRQAEGEALVTLGQIAALRSDYSTARALYEQSLQIFQATGARRNAGGTLMALGIDTRAQGDSAAAQAYLAQSLRLYREVGDRFSEGWALNILGALAIDRRDCAAARDCYEQCLRICREVGNRQGEGWVLNDLGVLAGLEEDDASQREYYEQSLQTFRELGDKRGESFVLINLGFISTTQGDAAAAQAHLERGLLICREIGYQWGEGVTLGKLGLLAHLKGDDNEANACSQQALRILREIGARPEEGYALLYLGHARLGLGQPVPAAEAYRAVLDLRRALDQPHLAAEALAGLARVALASADLTAAGAHVEEILLFLQHDTLAGVDEPLGVYLTCYQTLRAIGDTRSARVLEIAHQMLDRRAAKLTDETARRSFLENVAAHRAITAEFAVQAY